MNITDELERLSRLHKEHALTDDEFIKAKKRLLESHRDETDAARPDY